MKVLSGKAGETIQLGDDLVVTVLEMKGNKVRLEITAPAAPPSAAEVPPRVKLKVVIEPEEGGGYSAAIPALPGCFTQGDTLEEVRANAREAALGWLEASNNDNPFAPEDRSPHEIIEEIEL